MKFDIIYLNPILKRLSIFFCFLLLVFPINVYAQQANIWYIGGSYGIDFNSGSAKVFNGKFLHTGVGVNPGTACISDSSGRLLFYTDGYNIWQRNNVSMPNGSALNGLFCWQPLIIKRPNSSQYYLFYSPFDFGAGYTQLYYAVIDMSLNGGLGKVIQRDVLLKDSVSAKLGSAIYSNGGGMWLISHSWNGNTFYSYLISSSGISSVPVLSNVGNYYPFPDMYGQIKPSPDGHRIAMSITRTLPNDTTGAQDNPAAIELFDFNNTTGQLSNPIHIELPAHYPIAYDDTYGLPGMEFSPSGKLLYASQAETDSGFLFQINLCDYTQSAIQASVQKIWYRDPIATQSYQFQMQLAPDNKIYLAQDNDWLKLSVIEHPDVLGTGCDFVVGGLDLSESNGSTYVLPYFNSSILRKISMSRFNIQYLCYGSPTDFSLNDPVDSVHWNFGDPASGSNNFSKLLTPSHTYTQPGQFTATAIIFTNCYTDTLAKTFNIYSSNDNVLGNDTVLCGGDKLYLSPNIPGDSITYQWQDGSTADNYTVSQPGTYWVHISMNSCEINDSIQVSYLDLSNHIFPTNDTTLCDGNSLLLNAGNPGAQFAWNDASTAQTKLVNSDGQYWVNVTTEGCSVSDTINCHFVPGPSVDLGNDTSLCSGNELTLHAGFYSTGLYKWNDGTTADSLSVGQSGLYWVAVTDSGCTNSDSINVTFNSLPNVLLGNDTTLCNGDSLLLTVTHSPGDQYLWQDNSNSDQFLVKNKGVYSVKVTNSFGCFASDSIDINYKSIPAFTLGNDTSLCNGQSLALNIEVQGAGYLWNTGNTSSSLDVTSPGLYWLKVTDSGCAKSDSIAVSYKPNPVINLGSDTTLCQGQKLLLDVTNANGSYQWQDGSTGPSFVVDSPGTYSVMVDVNGCDTSGDIQIDYDSKPRISLGNDTTLCVTQELTLNASYPGSTYQWQSYQWQDGSTSPEYLVNQSGKYFVMVTNECGTSSDSIEVQFQDCACKFYVPTAFTPNHDGQNDIFLPKYQCLFSKYQMKVYDRWGQLIFESNNPNNGWDGTFKGQLQPTGTYVWDIRYKDNLTNNEVQKNGTVVLIR